MLEWSAARWQPVAGTIEDPALAVPLPIEALIDAGEADAAVASALRRRRHPEFLAERAEGRAEGLAEGVIRVLESRGLALTDDQRQHILAERDPERQLRWLVAAASCATVDELR